MQMVKRIFGGFFLALILLWLFSPKQELYYLLEKELKKKHIIISNETFKDKWIGFEISNADIYIEGAKMAKIEKLTFNFFLFYNSIDIKTIKINDAFKNMAPNMINHVNATYSVLKPLKAKLIANGSFGVMNGEVDIVKRKINLRFPVAKDIKTFKRFLRKDKIKGWYYEKTY